MSKTTQNRQKTNKTQKQTDKTPKMPKTKQQKHQTSNNLTRTTINRQKQKHPKIRPKTTENQNPPKTPKH